MLSRMALCGARRAQRFCNAFRPRLTHTASSWHTDPTAVASSLPNISACRHRSASSSGGSRGIRTRSTSMPVLQRGARAANACPDLRTPTSDTMPPPPPRRRGATGNRGQGFAVRRGCAVRRDCAVRSFSAALRAFPDQDAADDILGMRGAVRPIGQYCRWLMRDVKSSVGVGSCT